MQQPTGQSHIGKKSMYEVLSINRTSDHFYELMGPVFGSRDFEKQVGINCYDDPHKEFFVAVVNRRVIAVCSFNKGVISDCFTEPQYRRQGILTFLLCMALRGVNRAKATCTQASRGVFEQAGFTTVKNLKNYTMMEYSKDA